MSRQDHSKRRPPCPEESVFLDLLRTTDMLSRSLVGILKTEDLSANQYNVLRILRGAHDALPCGEIASRMITRDPDITRLLDRLEKRGLISRCRQTKDRRMVMAGITPEGLKLLMPGPSRSGAASCFNRTAAGCPQCRELIFWHIYLLQRLSSRGIKPWSIRDSEAPNLKRKDRHYEHPGYTANCHDYLEY
jgi:DNA-binding MarR family transcriptional regulator